MHTLPLSSGNTGAHTRNARIATEGSSDGENCTKHTSFQPDFSRSNTDFFLRNCNSGFGELRPEKESSKVLYLFFSNS